MKNNNIQKRSVEVIEYNNGKWKMIGGGWDLSDLNHKEIDDAFIAWRTKRLKEKCNIKLPLPKLLKN